MTYKTLADVNATTDVTNLFVYANEITNNLFMPLFLVGFFLVALLSSWFAQARFRGYARIDLSFAAASFSTFGLAVLMSTKTGLLSPIYLMISLVIAIISVIIIFNSNE